MLWIKALHIIFMVTWFAGLFYLPRLYVYHAMTADQISLDRFKVMERKLYYGIMTPGGILTTIFGLWLLIPNLEIYLTFWWMQLKLLLVVLLWVFHLFCGYYRKQLAQERNQHTHVFYRWFNEVPTVIMIVVIILIVVRP
jgi:putative membrane protein